MKDKQNLLPLNLLQTQVDQWIQNFGVRYFNELTDMGSNLKKIPTRNLT